MPHDLDLRWLLLQTETGGVLCAQETEPAECCEPTQSRVASGEVRLNQGVLKSKALPLEFYHPEAFSLLGLIYIRAGVRLSLTSASI
jgi:hypothetical protein